MSKTNTEAVEAAQRKISSKIAGRTVLEKAAHRIARQLGLGTSQHVINALIQAYKQGREIV